MQCVLAGHVCISQSQSLCERAGLRACHEANGNDAIRVRHEANGNDAIRVRHEANGNDAIRVRHFQVHQYSASVPACL